MKMNDVLASLGQKKPETGKAKERKIAKIHYSKLKPSDDNFYETEGIEKLAAAIRLAGEIKSPIHVRKTDIDEYEVIEGHRRRLATIRNVEEYGRQDLAFVPCIIEESNDLLNRINLILSNATQRERTDWEKMQEVKKLRELLEQYARENDTKIPAVDMRKMIGEILGMSGTKVAQLESIQRNLVPEAKERFESGEFPVSVAGAIAGLPQETQRHLAQKEQVTLPDVKKVKEEATMRLCAYDPEISCHIDQVIQKYKQNRNIAECPGCCRLCGYTDECKHVCKKVRNEEERSLTEKDLERIIFCFQDVKETLGYIKKQIPKVKAKDQEAAVRLKIMTESLKRYIKEMVVTDHGE